MKGNPKMLFDHSKKQNIRDNKIGLFIKENNTFMIQKRYVKY